MADQATEVTGLAGRYATALFELADETDALDAVAADLSALQTLLDDSADLARMVRSPVISRDEQGKAMTAILSKAGAQDLTVKFAGLLAANRRLFALTDIIAGFQTLLAAHRGEIAADIASAAPLSDSQTTAIKDALAKAMGSDVLLRTRVDPDLLGGLVVKVGSRMIDNSLRAKLQSLKLAMKGVG